MDGGGTFGGTPGVGGAGAGTGLPPDPSTGGFGSSPPTSGGGHPLCPPGPFGSPLTGAQAQKIGGVPPADDFNQNNGGYGIIEGPVWVGDALYLSEIAGGGGFGFPGGGFPGFPGDPGQGGQPGGSIPPQGGMDPGQGGAGPGFPGGGGDPPPSRILKVTADGQVSVLRADAGTNGLAVDAAGLLYGASHRVGGLVRFEANGAETVLVDNYQGARLNSPNDLAIRSDGTIYFSDPSYQAPSPQPQSTTRLYRWSPTTGIVALADLYQPNGVTLSLDETSLYVSTSTNVLRYPVNPDGSLGDSVSFAQGESDGMGLDCAGNLYLTRGSEVIVLSPQGSELGRIQVNGVQSVTNVAFGGADRTVLYVTALGFGEQKGLFSVKLGVPGLPY